MLVLTLNIGSSSSKAALFDVDPSSPLERPNDALWKSEETRAPGSSDASDDIRALVESLWTGPTAVIGGPHDVDAVGHRVVHGGLAFTRPTVVDDAVIEAIRARMDLAPAHNPANVAGIEASRSRFPRAGQVAVFDTGFHATLPPAAFTFSGPKEWVTNGIRRFGFHGISHEYVSHRAAWLLGRPLRDLRVVTCHLGNGCSLAAVASGQSVDTTMGFTPLDGLVMGSRSGSVDPGVLLHLLRGGASADELDRVLHHESGLLGLSGVSGDMRLVRSAVAAGDTAARCALDVFGHRLRGQIAAMAASMNGIDVLVFTAGIGEHDADTRAEATDGLGFLGVRIDEERNRAVSEGVDSDVSTPDASVRTLVVHTKENWAIARTTAASLR